MLFPSLLVIFLTSGPALPDSAADVVTLRDGQVLLGQWIEPAPRGKAVVVVRRAWAGDHAAEKLRAWQAAEAPVIKRARAERLGRLEAWRRERVAEAGDAISPWIEAEIAALGTAADLPPLLVVTLDRGDVRGLVRRTPGRARKLRQAWRAGFADAETRPIDELTSALEGRGFAVTGIDPAPIDDLLPMPIETEARWKVRRAATEVAHERSLRFIRYRGLLLPEGTPGRPIDAGMAVGGLVKSLLGEAPAEDPLVPAGREAASRGRVGLLVTRLDTAEDLSGVKVEVVLYARIRGDRWERAAARSADVRSEDLRPGDGADLADDPQVRSVFRTFEGLGLAVPDDLRRKGLNVGAATQKALGLARAAIQPDLDALGLPVGEPRRAD